MQKQVRNALITLALFSPIPASLAAEAADKPTVNFSTCAKPEWPKQSLRNNEQGTVTLSFRIEADGSVGESKVLKSSGFPGLDMAALDGIARCKFRPAMVGGKPEAATMKMQYVWTLKSKVPASAEQWRRAREGAARGEAQAQFDLANLYVNDSAPSNVTEATRLLQMAAVQNHAQAQSMLGMMLMPGRSQSADPVLAAEWLGKAAAQGEARAQHMLALLQMNGAGIARNRSAAIESLRKSHAQKYDASGPLLGMLLVERAANAEESAEGVALLRAAAGRQDQMALFTLGLLCENGRGVPKDLGQAAAYYEKAAALGNRRAEFALARLRGPAAKPTADNAR